MRLNDFIRNELGEEWVVERNGNVAMGNFALRPRVFIQDEGLLGLITALTSYQELKILLEAISKLHLEGVVSLEDWRDYERKDTVTPYARGKLNAALTQVLREERREAEERARRAEEERLRWEANETARREAEEERAEREKQVRFTFTTKIENVLLKESVRVSNIKLNDFLTMELGGMGIVDTNRNVILKEFVSDPEKYIHNKRVLHEIQTTDAYLRMEIPVSYEVIFQKDVRELLDKGVNNLLRWSKAAAAVKASVHNFTKHFLN
ncbi:retrotransposon hot spot (RHS) protein, putative, partial [Trypanosoma cruzi marinkellei]